MTGVSSMGVYIGTVMVSTPSLRTGSKQFNIFVFEIYNIRLKRHIFS
jgi:hypothetical protein